MGIFGPKTPFLFQPLQERREPRDPLFQEMGIRALVWGWGNPKSRGKTCRETILSLSCIAITLTAGVILKEEKSPLLCLRGSSGGILGDNLGEGNCESKIVLETGESIFAARHQDVSQGPLGN